VTSTVLNPHWWIPLAAYFLGSIPFGYLIVRLGRGRDIRNSGSGNIGAANVTRDAGTAAGVATLLFDAAKGFAAVWIAARYTDHELTWMVVAAVAAMLGHVFPVWLRFRGGRGVATGLGVFLPICWPAVAGAIAIWAIVLVFWRYVSLASMTAAASLPLLVYLLYAPGHAPSRVLSLGTSFAAILIIAKHQPNIARLMSGTEPKFELRCK
jgi:glycerol-3-phosphate acyltransferase PlsY